MVIISYKYYCYQCAPSSLIGLRHSMSSYRVVLIGFSYFKSAICIISGRNCERRLILQLATLLGLLQAINEYLPPIN